MVYNVKVKILDGVNHCNIIIKEYKKYLGYEREDIDDYNLRRKIQDRDNQDGLIKAIIEDYENKKSNVLVIKEMDKKSIRKDNIVRARNKVFDLAFSNAYRWKSFITLTFEENIQDIDYAYEKFNIWIKSVRRYLKKFGIEFYFIAVIEFQKRGAIHFHILTNIECGTYILPLQKEEKNKYDAMYWKHGFSSAFNIVKDVDRNFDVAKYMVKYMTKKNNDDRLFGRKRYYHSRNLDKPIEKKLIKGSMEYQMLLSYINNGNYKLINYYHHTPLQPYEIEYYHSEYYGEKELDQLGITDILDIDLEF